MKLVIAPSEILKIPTIDVDEDMDNIVQYAKQMHEIMIQSRGIGLSASQVGINKSFFIMGNNETYTVITNPKIIKFSDEKVKLEEGCLSFPDLFIKVLRPENVDVEYVNTNGKIVNETLTSMVSRVFQHEADHTKGVTFDTLVSKLVLNMAEKKRLNKWKKDGRRV